MGNEPGSVFQVAADMNNVTYRGGCCGNGGSISAASEHLLKRSHMFFALGVAFVSFFL
jgi:hypothetical protein